MMIMTRKPGQKIRVGDAVVTIIEASPTRIRIGIEAPQSVEIEKIDGTKYWATYAGGHSTPDLVFSSDEDAIRAICKHYNKVEEIRKVDGPIIWRSNV
ncbi:MAG: carbon storage regulator [Patescibacteria group bacterium]|nr:carbon storage regulator [Patescibacteria group bacterium]